MNMKEREDLIQNYIEGYNTFDIDKMVRDFDAAIVFENITNGEVNVSLRGIEAFREQATLAKSFFSTRRQTIKSFNHQDDEIEVELHYHAVLANDLPNGMKKGEELILQGKSIFGFSANKIIRLTDIS